MARQTAARRRSVRVVSYLPEEPAEGDSAGCLSGDAARRIPTVRPREAIVGRTTSAPKTSHLRGDVDGGNRNWQ
ncbi:hypothetical protein GS429_20030 [Natronorubrum sp. JWXQ-INN-674]|uniref:Uncharacterized protein n=1 Tax=Natronorubrum halalkaliphilum TaxID=2691917 RepID=A0A6B0VT30_9EURY|nr:hypothetical protein [Natronorubrum halalkaliphilum]MXV64313.1 hypothetical protein [Natronorubrum halalkaliphilum]